MGHQSELEEGEEVIEVVVVVIVQIDFAKVAHKLEGVCETLLEGEVVDKVSQVESDVQRLNGW